MQGRAGPETGVFSSLQVCPTVHLVHSRPHHTADASPERTDASDAAPTAHMHNPCCMSDYPRLDVLSDVLGTFCRHCGSSSRITLALAGSFGGCATSCHRQGVGRAMGTNNTTLGWRE